MFGSRWDKSPKQPGKFGSALHLLEGKIPLSITWFPSWRGQVKSKAEVLQNSFFNFAYENTIADGYITEKIFDSFVNGCVPVYWGAPDIAEYIPSDCFIDRRNFSDHKDLLLFLKSIDHKCYLNYQANIKDFLSSEQARFFSITNFVKIVSGKVLKDLGVEC